MDTLPTEILREIIVEFSTVSSAHSLVCTCRRHANVLNAKEYTILSSVKLTLESTLKTGSVEALRIFCREHESADCTQGLHTLLSQPKPEQKLLNFVKRKANIDRFAKVYYTLPFVCAHIETWDVCIIKWLLLQPNSLIRMRTMTLLCDHILACCRCDAVSRFFRIKNNIKTKLSTKYCIKEAKQYGAKNILKRLLRPESFASKD